MKRRRALRISTPGNSPASHRIWKPLQTPSTRPPFSACARTASMIGRAPRSPRSADSRHRKSRRGSPPGRCLRAARVSACQTIAGSWPEISFSVRAMSRSRLMPGKTRTADFIGASFRQRLRTPAARGAPGAGRGGPFDDLHEFQDDSVRVFCAEFAVWPTDECDTDHRRASKYNDDLNIARGRAMGEFRLVERPPGSPSAWWVRRQGFDLLPARRS